MFIRVLFFGVLRDLVGLSSDSLDLADGARLADVLQHYESRIPKLQALLPSVALSVNQQYVSRDVELSSGDEVAILPPVSGGNPRASIVREVINTQAVLQNVKAPEDGAAVVFEGVVRNNTRGRRTLYLDYEAYEGMALKQMEELASRAIERYGVPRVAIVHRLGRLEIGEISVLIAVASAHRGAAFDACRWIIDTLKKTVPIWKKEYFEDGAVWADGEPFPAEILSREGTGALPDASK
jgi:molybdopterin synthase catalytic subunit